MNKAPDPKQDQSNAAGGTAQQGGYPLDRYTVAPQQKDEGGDKSPYYKPSAPTITMPKGGGALKGIDEKFTVNAVNGTAGMQVAFPLTPGRGGFTPSLSVDYNSGSGNSEFGLGRSLSLPSIQRKTDKQLPRYNDTEESDVFLLAGAEDLQPLLIDAGGGNWVPDEFTDGDYHVKRYRPRIEGLYARIERIYLLGSNTSWWKVTTKDNIVTFYDNRVVDPEDSRRIFKWLPTVSYDNKGNVQLYEYRGENSDNVPLYAHESNRLNGIAPFPFTNLYLKRVKYCNRTPYLVDVINQYDISAVMPASNDFLMEAVLDYGDHDALVPTPVPDTAWPMRMDAFSDFHAGFEIRTYRRCMRLLMFHYFDELDGGNPVLVRSVDFAYYGGPAPTTFDEVDFITSITQSGYVMNGSGGYIKKSLPPVTLNHAPLTWDTTIHEVSPEDAQNAPQGLTGGYQWIDLYGEGLPGILSEQGHGWFYKRNLGDGHFTPALAIAPKPSLQGLGSNLQWQDLDADGRRQLVSMDASLPGYYELNDDQEWEPFRKFEEWINVDWDSPYTKMLDLNGDGRPDLLITEERAWRWYENEGTGGYTIGGEASAQYDEEKGPRLLHNDMVQTIFLADMNGDGMTDIVRIKNQEVCYWPNMGYGRFGAKVTMTDAPVFDTPDQFNPIYITLADISGTGCPDILYLGQNKCTAWINCAGNALAGPIDLITLPAIDPQTKISVMDFLGNGTACIVWSSPLPQHAWAPMRYIDLMGGKKPYLLTSYSNGMGKTVDIEYKQSTKYYLEDMRAGTPWATMLPFPTHCISKVTTSDDVSQTMYRQTYRYHHGYYDHEEREFRGFGRVDVVDVDTAVGYNADGSLQDDLDQYPVLTKTWYHTGAWMRDRTLHDAFAQEYFPTDPMWALPIAPVLDAGLTPQEQREAYRALKGSPLRQEVYGLDGSPLQGVPYSITSNAYCVHRVQPVAGNRFASFYNYQKQSLAWAAERDVDDARIAQSVTLEVDEYGNVLKSASVGYPRQNMPGGLPTIVADVQARMLMTYSETDYTNDILTDAYHLRVQYETRSYQVTGFTVPMGLWTVDDLATMLAGASEIEYTDVPTIGVEKRLLSKERTLYYEDDCTDPLALGTIESLAIPYNKYTLAFTDGILNNSDYYNGKVTDTMLVEGAYLREDRVAEFGSADITRYWLGGGTMDIEPANFYTSTKYYDPWGNFTMVTYWDESGTNYYLLPQSTTDALGSVSLVNEYNWYTLQHTHITDVNHNEIEIIYDALGMPVSVAVMSKDGSIEGDTIAGIDPESSTDLANQATFFSDPESVAADLLQGATWRCVYDFSVSPVAVGMIAREQHYTENPTSPMLIRLTYTDGMGRLAMHKVQAAPAEGDTDIRWVSSGKTVYNNKGAVVMQFEPYFSATPEYDPVEQAEILGVSPRLHYDAMGRNYRTEMPDGTYSKTEWSAWIQSINDSNDTVGDSDWYAWASIGSVEEQDAAAKALEHSNTPLVHHLDIFGREFYTVQHDKYPDPTTWTSHWYESYVELDILANRLAIHNARGLMPQAYAQNMVKSVVRQNSVECGESCILVDCGGAPLYSWDVDDREFHITYDELRRQLTYETTPSGGSVKILSIHEYGEGQTSDTLHNLRGSTYAIYDGAGFEVVSDYDFKGNPLAKVRQFVADPTQSPDWAGSVSMETEEFLYSITYDALNRVASTTTQSSIIGTGIDQEDDNMITYIYDKSGALLSVHINTIYDATDGTNTVNYTNDTDVINEIYYNARGQRIKIKYENGATTTYEYDLNTFRTTRIRTTRSSDSKVLQDLKYWYDPVGNITLQTDDAQQDVYYDNTVAEPTNNYTYDALYRLIKCEGREHAGSNAPLSYNDSTRTGYNPLPADAGAMRRYKQYYKYDEVGNMLRMQHTTTGGIGNWTRNFDVDTLSNKLLESSIGSDGTGTENYTYDTRGNMISGMNHLTSMSYNEENRLEVVVDISGNIATYYQYDIDGQRIRKVTVDTGSNLTYVRRYLSDLEIYQKINTGTSTVLLQSSAMQVMDGVVRVAIKYNSFESDGITASALQTFRYQFSNHLGSASLELDESADIITYEEYYPFGNTSFQGGRSTSEVSLKRYRFTGKEKDEETGLYYIGARYYASWLTRWCAIEPIDSEWYNMCYGRSDRNSKRHYMEFTASAYEYCYANPIRFIDPTGEQILPWSWVVAIDNFLDKALAFKFKWLGKLLGFLKREDNMKKEAKEQRDSFEITTDIAKNVVTYTKALIADLPAAVIKLWERVAPTAGQYAQGVKPLSEAGAKFFSTVGVIGSGINFAIDIAKTVHEYKKNDGLVKASTLINLGVTGVLFGLSVAVLLGAPIATFVAVVGVVYAVGRFIGGKQFDKWIDKHLKPVNVKKIVQNVATAVQKVVTGIKTAVTNTIRTVKEKVVNLAHRIADKVSSWFPRMPGYLIGK